LNRRVIKRQVLSHVLLSAALPNRFASRPWYPELPSKRTESHWCFDDDGDGDGNGIRSLRWVLNRSLASL